VLIDGYRRVAALKLCKRDTVIVEHWSLKLTFRRTEMRNPPFFTGAELSVFRLLSMVIRKGHEHERVE
jgi:hypothetical protein